MALRHGDATAHGRGILRIVVRRLLTARGYMIAGGACYTADGASADEPSTGR